jgi:hypothetical protein
VAYEIINRSTAPWRGAMYGQLKRDNTEDPSKSHQGMMMVWQPIWAPPGARRTRPTTSWNFMILPRSR